MLFKPTLFKIGCIIFVPLAILLSGFAVVAYRSHNAAENGIAHDGLTAFDTSDKSIAGDSANPVSKSDSGKPGSSTPGKPSTSGTGSNSGSGATGGGSINSGGGSTPGATTNPPRIPLIKPYIVGLMNRQGVPNTSLLSYNGQPLIKAFVIQINWSDIQPNGPADFNTSSIDSQLSFAHQYNLPVRFRLYAGYNSPNWVIDRVGRISWQGTANDGGPTNYDIPKFWNSDFQNLWKAYLQKMSDKYDSDSLVRDVVPAMCTTNFGEPFIRQFSVQANVDTAVANGYTESLNDACLRNTIDIYRGMWPTTRMAMTFNPYQFLSSNSSSDKNAEPTTIAQHCLSQLGARCILGNNSMQSASRGSDYDNMYSMMTAQRAPVYIQTATNAKIGDWQTALNNALGVGALSIELPVGYQSWDLGALQAYNGRLEANQPRILAR